MTAPGFFEEKLWKKYERFYDNLDIIGEIAIKLVLKYAVVSARILGATIKSRKRERHVETGDFG